MFGLVGDAHVYLTHVGPLQEQLKRSPRAFPKLFVSARKVGDISEYTMEDLRLVGYTPMDAIKMTMAI